MENHNVGKAYHDYNDGACICLLSWITKNISGFSIFSFINCGLEFFANHNFETNTKLRIFCLQTKGEKVWVIMTNCIKIKHIYAKNASFAVAISNSE